ncbi:MAG: hypothetical protein V4481_04835, partial [Patescibacteria group bacterium]
MNNAGNGFISPYSSIDFLLRDGSLPMTGNLDMADGEIKNTGEIRPRDDNDSDLGTASKRYKTVHYVSLSPVPGASVGGYVALDGSTTMAGDLKVATYNVAGSVNSRLANDIISNSSTAVPGNLASFVSDKVIQDSAIPANSVAIGVPSSVNGNIATFFGTGGKQLSDSSVGVNTVCIGPGICVSGNLPSFNGVGGKNLQDSGISSTSISGGPFLPLAGGTLSGTLNMGNNLITAVSAIRPNSTDVIIGNTAVASGLRSVAVGEGATTLASNDCVAISTSASINTGAINSIVIGPNSHTDGDTCIVIGSGSGQTANTGSNNIIMGKNTTVTGSNINDDIVIGKNATTSAGSNVIIGSGSSSTGSNVALCGFGNTATALAANCFGSSLNNATAGSLLVAASSNLRADTTTCDLGTVAAPFQSLYLNTNVAGPTNSRTADNIVSNSGASTSGHVASFSGSTGKVVTDSGVVAADIVSGPPSCTTAHFPVFNGTTGKLIADSGITSISNGITMSGDIAVNTDAFVTDATNKRIGINRTAPIFALDCFGYVASTNGGSAVNAKHATMYYHPGNDRAEFTSYDINAAALKNMLMQYNNFGLNSLSVGSGVGVIAIANATTVPSTNPSGGGVLYCEAGALKYRGSS